MFYSRIHQQGTQCIASVTGWFTEVSSQRQTGRRFLLAAIHGQVGILRRQRSFAVIPG